MGAAASVSGAESETEAAKAVLGTDNSIEVINFKKLPEAIEEAIFVHEKFPLLIDPTQQASRFLKYQAGSFLSYDDPTQKSHVSLNRAFCAGILNGGAMTLKCSSLRALADDAFDKDLFPKEAMNRPILFRDSIWRDMMIAQNMPKDDIEDARPSHEFVFILCVTDDYVPPELFEYMHVIKVEDKAEGSSCSSGEDPMEQIASLYGAAEVVRNSLELVEAAFDGDLEEMQDWIDKGYHLESTDGRKHTALSEACCQGHFHVVRHLLDMGADPNTVSDTNRSPLWRACFGGHEALVILLLQSGADPDNKDRVSLESCFDIAKTQEIRTLLSEWDRAMTAKLIAVRKAEILSKIEERIITTAERENFAKAKLRAELVELTEKADLDGVKRLLNTMAEEAEKTDARPRATAECRNTLGQSLLSIATQQDNEAMVTFFLTYWKEVDIDRWDLAQDELSRTATTFRTNPNSRDLKGWTCVCVAVFHNAKKALALLLEHGGDPNIRSSYNKNAWDLAKDELDAARNVMKDNSDIRKVLTDWDTTSAAKSGLFGSKAGGPLAAGQGVDMYTDLNSEGTSTVMNIEMNKELNNSIEKADIKPKKGAGKGVSTKKGAAKGGKKKK